MADEKKVNDPNFIMSTTESSEASRSWKKLGIIVGTSVVIIALILTAILVGVYFYSDVQKEILKFAFSRGDDWKEEVISDPNTNIVQYHINGDSYEAWIFNDFNRDIQVMKVRSKVGTNCYVAPLNRTAVSDPSGIAALAGKNPTVGNMTNRVTYRPGVNPIMDTSFLVKPATDACQGISTYWAYPSCIEETELAGRQKRRPIHLQVDFVVIETDNGIYVFVLVQEV